MESGKKNLASDLTYMLVLVGSLYVVSYVLAQVCDVLKVTIDNSVGIYE